MKINNSAENQFFEKLYTPDWSMALGVLTSLINIIVLTPMSYSVIWYERFGSNHPRTVLNQLVSSMCWNIIFQNLINFPLEILLTIFGPFSEGFCLFHMTLKHGALFHILMMMFSMTSAKYLSIFVLKNPGGVKSEFWVLFINIVTIFASLITQSVYLICPGVNPVNFYVCSGQEPGSTFNKRNYPMILVLLLDIIWYLFAVIKIEMFKKKNCPQIAQGQSRHLNGWTLPPVSDVVFEKNTLVNLASIALTFTTMIPVSIVYMILKNMLPETSEENHNIVLLHFYHHGTKFILNVLLIVIFLSKSSLMRNSIWREIKESSLGMACR